MSEYGQIGVVWCNFFACVKRHVMVSTRRSGTVTVVVKTAPAKRKSGTTHRNKATTKKAPAKKAAPKRGRKKAACSTGRKGIKGPGRGRPGKTCANSG